MIIDYVKNNNISFKKDPFKIEDALVLAEVTYFKFERIPKFKKIKIKDLKNYVSELTSDTRNALDKDLLVALIYSSRFRNLTISNLKYNFSKETEEQFLSLTIKLSPFKYFIGYRGTDGSLVGWKEDFNMAFMDDVPAQKSSLAYLNDFNKFFGKCYVAGHSKGGNLAYYASLNAKKSIKKKLINIYNFDGPGIRHELIDQNSLNYIKHKIIKIVPKSSVIGLLLEEDVSYNIVNSKSKYLMQHELYSWIIEDTLSYANELDEFSVILKNAIDNWLVKVSLTKRAAFIDALFKLLGENFTFNDLYANFKELEEQDKQILKEALGVFKTNVVSEVKNRIFDYLNNKRS